MMQFVGGILIGLLVAAVVSGHVDKWLEIQEKKAEKNRSQAAVDYPVQVDCLTILRPVKPVLRKLGVTFPLPPPPIIWWKQQDSSRRG